MYGVFNSFSPVIPSLCAGLFTWAMTGIGAATVFMAREVNRRFLDLMLGFAGGVMLAASYWSLLAPAIAMSAGHGIPVWIPAVVGFLVGGIVMRLAESALPYMHINIGDGGGNEISHTHTMMLVLAVTIHNIPEGMAIGVAFGAFALGYPAATLAGAIGLVIGIGIQNLPEGMAVSMPLRREGVSARHSFYYGQMSGVVEPVAAGIGAAAILVAQPLLPYALSFAAGAMVFVVVEEIIPEAQENPGLATIGLFLGFAVMMALDVALG